MGLKRARGTSRVADVASIDRDRLLSDNGRRITHAEIVQRIQRRLGYPIANKTIARFLSGRQACDDWQPILDALCVHPDRYEGYLLPRGEIPSASRTVLRFDLADAAGYIAGWRGDPARWLLSKSAGPDEPLRDLAYLRSISKARWRDDFLFLQAYVAWKMGVPGVEAYYELGCHGALSVVANGSDEWRCAAAHYFLGNLHTTMSVSRRDPVWQFRVAELAYQHWSRLATVGLQSPLLLPGVLSETDKVHLRSTGLAESVDPTALVVPRPERYLAAVALRLAYLSMGGSRPEAAAGYLAMAGGHVDRVRVDPRSIAYRALNLRLCRSTVDLFEVYRKRSRDRHVLYRLRKEFGSLRVSLDKGFQAGEVPEVKFLEWMANIDFCEFTVVKTIKGEVADSDRLFVHLRKAVALRGGRGSPVFEFDPIFRLPIEDDAELMGEFGRIVSGRV
jgi:hypothetical protein